MRNLLAFILLATSAFAATQTANLSLNKPQEGDTDYVTTLNQNADILDAAILDKRVGGTINGNLTVTGSITGATFGGATVYVDTPIQGNGAPSNHLRLDPSSVTLLGPRIAFNETDGTIASGAYASSIDAAKVNRAGDTVTGDLRINGALFQGKKPNAQIALLECAGGLGDCFVLSSDEGDFYTSISAAPGGYRNARTGKAP